MMDEITETNIDTHPPEREEAATDQAPKVNIDVLQREIHAYRKHFEALNVELAEIKAKYGNELSPEDRVSVLSAEVQEMRKSFSELKDALAQSIAKSPPPQPQQWQFPQQQVFQPPGMSYIQTPSYMPIMPLKQ